MQVEEFVLPHLTTDQNNTTPLYVASEKGDHDGVQRLLGACADVNVARSDVSDEVMRWFITS